MEEKRRTPIWIIWLTALIFGVIGGSASYYLMSGFDLNSLALTTSSSSSATLQKTSTHNGGTMTSAYNKVKGAVVSVINYKRGASSSSDLEDILGDNTAKSSNKLQIYGEGSGVIYLKNNNLGYIVTNNHVISGADKIKVVLASGKVVDAKLVGKDSTTDLAVLSIDAKYVTQVASFGDSSSLVAGQTVIAVGSPLGTEYASTVTQGIISAASRTITTSSGNQQTVIQTDAAINPGNSGGALVNADGQVVGINSMKLSGSTDGTSVEGMGFAIPSKEVVAIINQLVKNGKIVRPKLGIQVVDLSQLNNAYRQQLGITSSLKKGVYVVKVTSSATKASGLKSKDVILSVDGESATDIATLHTILYKHKVGDTVTLKINRDGKEMTLKVKLQS
ncbi:MAG: trypsin-like peptidase domain-containing protein [Lactobacillus sp.]|nr:trypsin-like peptidase domain-containing protein [Lactobacillus sp.]